MQRYKYPFIERLGICDPFCKITAATKGAKEIRIARISSTQLITVSTKQLYLANVKIKYPQVIGKDKINEPNTETQPEVRRRTRTQQRQANILDVEANIDEVNRPYNLRTRPMKSNEQVIQEILQEELGSDSASESSFDIGDNETANDAEGIPIVMGESTDPSLRLDKGMVFMKDRDILLTGDKWTIVLEIGLDDYNYLSNGMAEALMTIKTNLHSLAQKDVNDKPIYVTEVNRLEATVREVDGPFLLLITGLQSARDLGDAASVRRRKAGRRPQPAQLAESMYVGNIQVYPVQAVLEMQQRKWLKYRIGKGTNRPILIKLNSFITKQQILDNARMLKGSNYKLDNDYDFNTRQIRKKLLPFMHEARDNGHRANIINDKLKINGKIYDLDQLENVFTNAENFEHINNRKHTGRNRSNSPTPIYNESPNWLLRRRRFSSSERGRQEEEIEQLNYKIPRSPTIRSSTDERLENSRKSRSEERRTRVTKKPHFSNEIDMSASAVEFRPSIRRQSKSPEGRNQDVDGTAVTRLRSGNSEIENGTSDEELEEAHTSPLTMKDGLRVNMRNLECLMKKSWSLKEPSFRGIDNWGTLSKLADNFI
ncbi:hypothetical protein C0J52_23919 [Blattella germanica]|nr:hypothetical protein C0J52_23919 [Blattella germanica]